MNFRSGRVVSLSFAYFNDLQCLQSTVELFINLKFAMKYRLIIQYLIVVSLMQIILQFESLFAPAYPANQEACPWSIPQQILCQVGFWVA